MHFYFPASLFSHSHTFIIVLRIYNRAFDSPIGSNSELNSLTHSSFWTLEIPSPRTFLHLLRHFVHNHPHIDSTLLSFIFLNLFIFVNTRVQELCMHYEKDFGIQVRVARFHNIYGPEGTWKGGREKVPKKNQLKKKTTFPSFFSRSRSLLFLKNNNKNKNLT